MRGDIVEIGVKSLLAFFFLSLAVHLVFLPAGSIFLDRFFFDTVNPQIRKSFWFPRRSTGRQDKIENKYRAIESTIGGVSNSS